MLIRRIEQRNISLFLIVRLFNANLYFWEYNKKKKKIESLRNCFTYHISQKALYSEYFIYFSMNILRNFTSSKISYKCIKIRSPLISITNHPKNELVITSQSLSTIAQISISRLTVIISRCHFSLLLDRLAFDHSELHSKHRSSFPFVPRPPLEKLFPDWPANRTVEGVVWLDLVLGDWTDLH